jgi:enoyl-[acyl-carrier protein] reductase I
MSALVSLAGKRGLVIGIANEHSIAAGCAEAFAGCGARLAATYLNDKALPFVTPTAERLGIEWLAPCDVREEGQLEALFERVREEWGGSISCSIQSRSPRARTCTAVWSIAARTALRSR